jgi:hypothetical protein
LTLLLAIAVLSGCSKPPATGANGSSGSTQEQADVMAELTGNPEVVDDEVSEAADETSYEASAGVAMSEGVAAAIQPIHFWRRIDQVDRRFEFAFGDPDSGGRPTTAWVTVHKRLLGTFNILTAPRADSVFERNVVHKRLDDRWTRRLLLKRVRVSESGDMQWRIVSHSGIKVRAHQANTAIVSLRVQCGTVDTVITDPLGFLRVRRLLRFSPRDSVVLTVTTGSNTDVVVSQWRDRRFRFRNNGDNTYTGVFLAPRVEGVRHIGVNALSHGTLFDDEARYDSEAWIFPYVVVEGEGDLAAGGQ